MAQPKPQRITGEDPVTVDSRHYRVEFENEKVRVLRVRYGPRERSTMHGHPDTVAIFLNGGQVRFTYPDGKTEEVRITTGQTMYNSATNHLPENLGDNSFELVLVELKQ